MARVVQVGDSIGESSLLHDTFYCFDHHNFALFLCSKSIFFVTCIGGVDVFYRNIK